ncbi:MAG: ubiquinone biosynthesis regulatory protein kinase UbiB [Pseudomonadota bacterium]
MFKDFAHLLRIARVLVQYNLDEFLEAVRLFRPLTIALKLYPRRWRKHADVGRGERLRFALQDLGPVFVKFGQMLSTRPDLLAPDIFQALIKLQDEVPPFPGTQAKEIIEQSLGATIDSVFEHFEVESTASASVAQVHYARLRDGKNVVVKVLRPGVEEIIDRDLDLLHTLAALADRYWAESKRLKPREVVSDYDKTIHDELDLKREAANASQLRINFEDSDLIYVPEVYWDYTRRNVMVMERIYGIPIREVEKIKSAGINMKKLAHDGVEIFFTQAFRDGFFHADMHPGNIFVAEDGQYRAVDFGIMGTLGTADKRYLAENFLAFFNRDYHAVADAHIRAGWVPPDTNAEDFEGAIRTVCEPIFAKPISEISFGHFLLDLFRVARRFQMPVQPQLVLLQKTVLNIEGLGRQLYPDLDLWETAKPFLEKWMSEQIGPRAALRTLRRELPNLFTLAPELPALTHQLMYRLKNDEMVLKTHDQEVHRLREAIVAANQRLSKVICGLGLLLIAFVTHDSNLTVTGPGDISWLALCAGFAGAAFLVSAWLKRIPR